MIKQLCLKNYIKEVIKNDWIREKECLKLV